MEEDKKRIWPIIFLVVSNLIPLIGVLFFNWSLFSIMFLYWMENFVIGFYNLLRMNKAIGTENNVIYSNGKPLTGKKYVIRFFILHFGGFTAVHGIAIFSIFGPSDISVVGIVIAFLSLLVSHGISYKNNYIDKQEYLRTSAGLLMGLPYGRVIVMHLLVLIGGNYLQNHGYTTSAMAMVVLLKLALDILSHLLEHAMMSKRTAHPTAVVQESPERKIKPAGVPKRTPIVIWIVVLVVVIVGWRGIRYITDRNGYYGTEGGGDAQEVKGIFQAQLDAMESCDIQTANSMVTRKSQEMIRYTCANMSNERKCYIGREAIARTKLDTAILYFSTSSYSEGWPFFFTKEDGEWKIDYYKMSNGITMLGGGCDTGWGWRSEEAQKEFCSFFPDGECPNKEW